MAIKIYVMRYHWVMLILSILPGTVQMTIVTQYHHTSHHLRWVAQTFGGGGGLKPISPPPTGYRAGQGGSKLMTWSILMGHQMHVGYEKTTIFDESLALSWTRYKMLGDIFRPPGWKIVLGKYNCPSTSVSVY